MRYSLLGGATLMAAVGLAALAQGATARELCTEPLEPLCIADDGMPEDPSLQQRCATDAKRYASALREYHACLSRKVDNAQENWDTLMEKLNCAENGSSACPEKTGLD